MSHVEYARKQDLPPCKRCGAKQGKPCRGPNGAVTFAHRIRNPWVPLNDDDYADELTAPAPEEHW